MPNSDYTAALQGTVLAIDALLASGACDITRAHDLARTIGAMSDQSGFPEIASVAGQAEDFLARYLDGGAAIDPEIFENLMLNLQGICRMAIAEDGI
ncbi:MAG: hypothetical protein ACXW30_06055 [Micavibrio sp.]